MRYFIAIGLPGQIRTQARSVQTNLKSLGLDAKWVEFDNLHLTLKFLGQIEEANVSLAKQILSKISSFAKPFSLELSCPGVFPSLRRPRVLWLGVEPLDAPVRIIRFLDEECARLGILPEKREPHPHITLARLRSFKNAQKLEERFRNFQISKLSWQVENISLFKSTLTYKGPIYEEIFKISLIS